MTNAIAQPHNALLVVCLCADWCGTCRDYRPIFEAVAAGFSNVKLLWIDVEDEADLVDPIDVADFPTVLIANGDQVAFFGTVMPHRETLQRLIETQRTLPTNASKSTPEVQALASRLWQKAKG